jgi:serine/threonine protein kinase
MDTKQKLNTHIKLRMMCPTCDKEVGSEHQRCPDDGGLLCPVAGQDPLLGARVERYQVLDAVGQGSSSNVYLARNVETGQTVAMKVLKCAITTDPASVKRFQQEAQALIALDHQDIPSVYDFGLLPDGRPFIIMEYVYGDTLTEVLAQKGRLDSTSVIQLFLDIADVLDSAHRNGILHRDIKPSNIIIDSSGNTKVVDFGLAKIVGLESSSTVTRTNAVMGTPAYMSPEQCYGQELDARSDIYSVGCVMYECLTGQQVFPSSNSFKCMHDHVFNAPRAVSEVEPGVQLHLDALVLHCLEKEPSMRVQSMADLKLALMEVRNRRTTKIAYMNKSFRDLKTKARRTIKQHRNKMRKSTEDAPRRTLNHPLGSTNFRRMIDTEKSQPLWLTIAISTAFLCLALAGYHMYSEDQHQQQLNNLMANEASSQPVQEEFNSEPWEKDPWSDNASMTGVIAASPEEEKAINSLTVAGVSEPDGVWLPEQATTVLGKMSISGVVSDAKTVDFSAFTAVPSKKAGEWFLLNNFFLGFFESKGNKLETIPIQYYVNEPSAIAYDTKRDQAAIIDEKDLQSIHIYKKKHLPWSEMSIKGGKEEGMMRGLAYDSHSDCYYTMVRGTTDTTTYLLRIGAADGIVKSTTPLPEDLCSLTGWNVGKISLSAQKGYLIATLIRSESLHAHDMSARQFVIKPNTGEIVYAHALSMPATK